MEVADDPMLEDTTHLGSGEGRSRRERRSGEERSVGRRSGDRRSRDDARDQRPASGYAQEQPREHELHERRH